MEDAESNSDGWAKQVYQFWRLFLRLGDTFAGLLLAEGAFLLVLGLIAGLGEKDSTPTILFPDLPWFWNFVEVPLTYLVLPGTALVFALWCLTSGHWVFIVRPLVWLLRPVLFITFQVLYFIFAVLHLPVQGILWLIEKQRFEKWKKNWNSQQREVLEGQTREAQLTTYRQQTGARPPDFLVDVAADFMVSWMANQMSSGTICLAPLYAYTYAEDEQASKAMRQILAHAFNRARMEFRSIAAGRDIGFVSLPPTYAPRDLRAASIQRKWLNADLLLWGSFEKLEPPTIWMNLEDRTPAPEAKDPSSMGQHPYDPIIGTRPSMIVRLNDALDAYLLAVMSLLRVLWTRQHMNWWFIFSETVRRYGDRLKLSARQEAAIAAHLLDDALPRCVEASNREAGALAPRAWLVGYLSDWLADRALDPHRSLLYEDDKRLKGTRLCGYLYKLMTLEPDRAEHRYRLAAAHYLIDGFEAASGYLGEAQRYDKANADKFLEDNRIGAGVHLVSLQTNASKKEIVQAMIHVARALALGGDEAKTYLQTRIRDSAGFQLVERKFEYIQEIDQTWQALLDLVGISLSADEGAATNTGRSTSKPEAEPPAATQT